MPSLDQVQQQLKAFILGLSAKQKAMLVGGTILTAAVLFAFVHFISTPDFKPLVTGMEPADAQSLAARLAAKNIQYQISSDGKVLSVPSDQLDASRMEVATQGMPRSGRLGFEIFDKLNWGQTEFDEKVNYQRALEGELERSIQTLRDVESVRVHLVLPTDSLFADRDRGAKASVVLKLRTGQLSPDTQLAIARLVSGAVDRLGIDSVTVVDADTSQPLPGSRHGAFGSGGDLEQQLTSRLVETLQPVVGAQHVKASVNVEYDPTTSEENQETYDPKSAVAVTQQMSEEQIGGMLSSGVPGTSSNVPSPNATAKTSTASGDGMQISKSSSSTFAVNKVVRHTLQPAGRIRRLTAALLLDDAVDVKQENGKTVETRRKRTPEELKQIDDLARAAVGIDVNRGDVLSVQEISFSLPAVQTPSKPTTIERVRVTLNDFSSYVRYAAILFLFIITYLLLLRPVKKQVMTTLRELPARVAAKVTAPDPAAAEIAAAREAPSLTMEQQKAANLKKQLAEKVKGEPAVTSRLIQAWIHEDGR